MTYVSKIRQLYKFKHLLTSNDKEWVGFVKPKSQQ